MSLKLTIFLIIITCLAIVGFLIYQQNPQSVSSLPATPPAPQATLAPSPTPLVIIDSNSNLKEETKKLEVSDFSSDYQKLDQSLSQF